jgi:tetratricopeptide (TPR) repeat protein
MLGRVLVHLHRRDEGIMVLQKAIKAQEALLPKLLVEYSSNYDSQMLLAEMEVDLAHAFLREKRWDEAGTLLHTTVERLRKTNQAAPHHYWGPDVLGRALVPLAEWYARRSRPVEAVRCIDEMLKLRSPKHEWVRAWADATGPGAEGRRGGEASKIALTLLQKEPSAVHRMAYAAALLRDGQAVQAVAQLEQVLRTDDEPRARLLLARAKYRVGDREGAREQHRLALRRATSVPGVRDDPEWGRLEAETAQLLGLGRSAVN